MTRACVGNLLFMLAAATVASAQTPVSQTTFHVRQVAAGSVYLDAGSTAGLAEGMTLTVKRLPPGEALVNAKAVAEIVVAAVARNSALCDVSPGGQPIQEGDLAELSASDAQLVEMLRTSGSQHGYAQIVSFTGDEDPIEDELRAAVPRPPLPEVNRLRGRVLFDYGGLQDHASGGTNLQQVGLAVRADMTRLGGSYWNLSGYWRGRINTRSGAPQTQSLLDLMNRTYHLSLYYNNPRSRNTFGFGRLLVPWASSLSTIDGGYYARRLKGGWVGGAFAGTTPDPTAWNYDPNRQIAGVFTSVEKGRFDNWRYTGTVGVALTRIHWRPEREYLFLENAVFYRSVFSVFHNVEIDRLKQGRLGTPQSEVRPSRSFLTVRFQPSERISFDLTHNYFRWVPSFDSRLVGTGLVDQLLFQGLSGGFRLMLTKQLGVSATLGRDSKNGDAKPSWNRMYGVTWRRIPWVAMRADARYARFDSSFGSGTYSSVDLSREMAENFRVELQAGRQDVRSGLSSQSRAWFGNCQLQYLVGTHYILGGGLILYRGNVEDYNQYFLTLGYRFGR